MSTPKPPRRASPDIPRLLPAPEVEVILDLTPRGLFDWDRRGWLTPVHRGGRKYYDAEQVARRATEGTPKPTRKIKK